METKAKAAHPQVPVTETIAKIIFTPGQTGVRVELSSVVNVTPRKLSHAQALLRRAYRQKHGEMVTALRRQQEAEEKERLAKEAEAAAKREKEEAAKREKEREAAERAELARLKAKYDEQKSETKS